MLDGGEYILKPSEQTKTKCIFSICTKIPTLIDNIEHDVSLTISINMVKVRVFAKIRYIWSLLCQNQLHTKHTPGTLLMASLIVPEFGLKRPGTSDFVYFA